MPTPSSRRPARLTLVAALLAGTALGGFAVAQTSFAAATTEPANGTPAASPIQPQPTGTQLPDFSNLVIQVKPAVVSITNHLRADAAEVQGGGEGSGGLPFPFGQMIPHAQPRAVEARGSGFIIDADGTIVTNNHVVKDARSLEVTLDDGTELPAKVIGTDPRTDLAVLKVNAGHKLPFIQLGESESVKPGQWVVAMGNPFGLGGTVTAGIVSARGRDIGDGPYDSFIQIDAPINQGNSGGPLFTQDGKVVGVNTAILSPTGGSVGIGFAIPSDTVQDRGGAAREGRPCHARLSRRRGAAGERRHGGGAASASGDKGALVAQVQPNSPASKAGLQPGDVITAVNGKEVTNPRDLAVDVAAVPPDSAAQIHVLRDGQQQDVAVTVARLQDNQTANAENGPDDQRAAGHRHRARAARREHPRPARPAGRRQGCGDRPGAAELSGRRSRAAAGRPGRRRGQQGGRLGPGGGAGDSRRHAGRPRGRAAHHAERPGGLRRGDPGASGRQRRPAAERLTARPAVGACSPPAGLPARSGGAGGLHRIPAGRAHQRGQQPERIRPAAIAHRAGIHLQSQQLGAARAGQDGVAQCLPREGKLGLFRQDAPLGLHGLGPVLAADRGGSGLKRSCRRVPEPDVMTFRPACGKLPGLRPLSSDGRDPICPSGASRACLTKES